MPRYGARQRAAVPRPQAPERTANRGLGHARRPGLPLHPPSSEPHEPPPIPTPKQAGKGPYCVRVSSYVESCSIPFFGNLLRAATWHGARSPASIIISLIAFNPTFLRSFLSFLNFLSDPISLSHTLPPRASTFSCFFSRGVSRCAAVRLSPIDCGPRRANVCCPCETNKNFRYFPCPRLSAFMLFLLLAPCRVHILVVVRYPSCTLVLLLPLHHDIIYELQFSSV